MNEANQVCLAQALQWMHRENGPVKMSSIRDVWAGQISLLGETAQALREQQEGRGFKIWHVYICILNVTMISLRFVKTVKHFALLNRWTNRKKASNRNHIFYKVLHNIGKRGAWSLSYVKTFPNFCNLEFDLIH